MERNRKRLAAAAVLAAAALLGGVALLRPAAPPGAEAFRPEVAMIPAGTFEHRLDGDWRQAGRAVDAPLAKVAMDRPLTIMAYPVSVADYAACVAEAACARVSAPGAAGDLPVTGVNYLDAEAYAAWLSAKTGERWRLPTDAEWAHAAGSRFVDDATGIEDDPANPAARWLREYELEAARKRGRDPALRPLGGFGANEHGVHDMAGNVWEWTSTCLRRVDLDAGGGVVRDEETCGIYIVEGRHRAAMTLFVRDPKSGGCSVGTPPDHLGFRLVREDGGRPRILESIAARLSA